MNIKNLKIEDYKNLDIELIHNSDIIALIGNNGSGKSNLLEALSLIFRSLYKKTEPVSFDYSIEYENTNLKKIRIEKKRTKITFKVDDLIAINIDEFLPKKIVAIYSGEEERLWKKIYFSVYEDFVRNINRANLTGLPTNPNNMPQMLYLNKYYWHLSLLSLIISDLPDNQDFVKGVLKIQTIEKIKFDFNSANYKNYAGSPVLDFINIIDEKSEYTLAEFKKLVSDNGIADADVFNNLYIANSPKGSKIINDIIILYNEHLTIEDFSEGEKKLLLIKAAFEFAEQEDSLFILDEPDAHIHLNNKEQIIKTFEPYKKNRQIVFTTHSPTVTQAINDDDALFMLSKGKIIERKKQEIIADLTDDFWNKHQQSSFLSSQKKLILLVEGKHDKLHIENAHNKLKIEYPTLDFDIFSLGGEGKIHPFMNGLYEANLKNDVIYLAIYDNDNAGVTTLNKAGFEPDTKKSGYRKLKKDKNDHNNFFALTLVKPEGFTADCTIENMFECDKYEEAYKEALDKSIGNFANKSIEVINSNLKDTSKNILAENSKNFQLEDFVHFRKLFNLIVEVSNLNKSTTPPKPTNTTASLIKEPYKVKEKLEEKTLAEEKNEESAKIAKEIKVYKEKDHTDNKSVEIINLFKFFKTAILDLSTNIDILYRKDYIAFKKGKNIVDITIQTKGLKLWINLKKGQLDDPKNITRDVSSTGHWGNGDYEILVDSTENLDYIMSLIKQAL